MKKELEEIGQDYPAGTCPELRLVAEHLALLEELVVDANRLIRNLSKLGAPVTVELSAFDNHTELQVSIELEDVRKILDQSSGTWVS